MLLIVHVEDECIQHIIELEIVDSFPAHRIQRQPQRLNKVSNVSFELFFHYW